LCFNEGRLLGISYNWTPCVTLFFEWRRVPDSSWLDMGWERTGLQLMWKGNLILKVMSLMFLKCAKSSHMHTGCLLLKWFSREATAKVAASFHFSI
jgi:hypothetical protein